ncbi:MAG: FAD:protein FMN transferase, partial [Polaribacter sp.]
MIKIKNIFFFLAILIGFTFCKNEEKPNRIILNGHIFGTTYKIVYTHSSINYKKSIDSLFYLVNKSLSTYMPTSDISKINAGDSTIVVDDLFLEVFKKSKKIYTETNGFFDPTVGNLVNAYGFGPKNEKTNLTEDEVKKQMQYVGLNKVTLIDGKIVKEKAKIYLDFNSIA